MDAAAPKPILQKVTLGYVLLVVPGVSGLLLYALVPYLTGRKLYVSATRAMELSKDDQPATKSPRTAALQAVLLRLAAALRFTFWHRRLFFLGELVFYRLLRRVLAAMRGWGAEPDMAIAPTNWEASCAATSHL